jgi:hypothetical protein
MSANLSPAELTLLQYLHDHAGVAGGRIGLDPKAIKRELRISVTRLAEDSASLAAHGFAGVRHTRPGADDVPSTTCSAIWVTSKGQDYLRRSQSGPRAGMTPSR